MSKTKSIPRSDWKNMLMSTPTRNEAAKLLVDEENRVSVSVRNRRPNYSFPPISWFIPYKPVITMELEGLGARLWRCCDGQHNVEQLCDLFASEYGLSFHEARTAVTSYLRQLIQRGVLAIILKQDHT